MKPTSDTLALRILGALILAVAAVRLVMSFLRTFRTSEPAPPNEGFIIGVSIDHLTLGLVAVGVLLCVLGFRGRKSGE